MFFKSLKNGAITYRWDIQEEVVQIEESKTQYSCYEVTIYAPIAKEQLTQAVITSIWG